MRPDHIEEIMLRSAVWEHSIHHWEKPGFNHSTKPVPPEGPVKNKDLEPVNASQAAHDRMQLTKYVVELERRVEEANELYKKTLDELGRFERALQEGA